MNAPSTPLQQWTFDELVQEGVALVPGHAPAWTNHNASDPGITLIEVLAYVAEALVYRLSRVTPQAKLEFLRLLRGAGWSEWKQLAGAPGAVIDEELAKAVRELGQCECAITASDFEQLAVVEAAQAELGPRSSVRALCVPGADLERGAGGHRAEDTSAHVTVVVMPRQELDAEAIAGLCSQVRQALLPRCLLTTRLHVVGPIYLHLAIGARIALRPGADRQQVLAAIDANLHRRIGPWGEGPSGDARPLGSPIRINAITEVVDDTEGVDYVEDVFAWAMSARAVDLSDTASRVGVQVGIHSTPGIDTRLGVATVAGTQRLQRDDAGRLTAIALQPWEVARVRLAPQALQWIDAEPTPQGPASGEAGDER
jgi:hypothetical protein